jgi:signal transduction histidine kinase
VALLVLGSAIYIAVASTLADASVAQLRSRALSLSAALAMAGKLPAGEGDALLVSDPGRPGIMLGGQTSGTLGVVMEASTGGSVFSRKVTAPANGDGAAARGVSIEPGVGSIQKVVPPDADMLLSVDEVGLEAARNGQTTLREVSLNGTRVRVLSQPYESDGVRYVIQVVGDRTSEVQTLGVLLVVLIGGAVLVLIAALGVGHVYSGRALVPIRESLRRQREFAADASHELRTPLAVVRASVDHLRRHPEQSVAASGETIDDIDEEVTRLTALVDDLLLLARTDSGGIDIERNRVDLAEAALEAVDGLTGVADSRNTRVELELQPIEVTGDQARLRQLVSLLVDNALRHGPGGQLVRVRIRNAQSAAVVEVEDEGPGIRPEDLPHIFDRFYRAAEAPSGGTGLGLAIAAWITERHGGSIRAENLPDQGARFTVTLPAT